MLADHLASLGIVDADLGHLGRAARGKGWDGRAVYDVSSKEEPWRRGYYETAMLGAKAAEQRYGWVRDRTTNRTYPGDVVVGPSNPRPKALPAGYEDAPLEENCERAFPAPEWFYSRILSPTHPAAAAGGFTTRQRIEALLGWAAWEEHRGKLDKAWSLYELALLTGTLNLGGSGG